MRRWKWAPALVLIIVFSMLSLLLGQLALRRHDHDQLALYTASLLDYNERVSDNIVGALRKASQLPVPRCSPLDLELLRSLVIETRFIRDIGRLNSQSQIICSAVWGMLETPSSLPPPYDYPFGLRVWSSEPTPGAPNILVDLTANEDTVVSTSPTAFDGAISLNYGDASAILRSPTGDAVHGKFGAALASRSTTKPNADDLTSSLCSNTYELCVDAWAPPRVIFLYSPWSTALLIALGVMSGLLTGLALEATHLRNGSHRQQLKRTLEGKQSGLSLCYQPLCRLRDERIHGVEALVRWRDDTGKPLSPEVFVPMIEEMGMASQLSRQVVTLALDELGDRLRQPGAFYVSINLMPCDVVDIDFHQFLKEALAHRQIAPERVALEITEHTTATRSELIEGTRNLSEHGFRLYMDDFGTGYSSLSYLADLHIDAIKIDRSFTRAIGTDSPVENVVTAICALAKKMQVGIIVEGVEEPAQALRVRQLAPDALGQGWLYGKPVAIKELSASLADA